MRDRDLCNMSAFLYLTGGSLLTGHYIDFETGIRDESKFNIPKQCLDVSISYLTYNFVK